MADEKVNCIVVGAGPAGVSAAITMARAGLSVVVLERGEYPGAKNVQGAILYTQMLHEIIPNFWKDPKAAIERPVTEQRLWVMSDDSAIQLGFKSDRWLKEPHNCYTIVRVPFDQWYAKKAEEAGATLVCGMTVSDVIRANGRIVGVKTHDGEQLLADCVIAADGVNSMVAQMAGLRKELRSDEVALGVKEILAMPREKIEDRFCLERGEGATNEMLGKVTQGMLGYAFLYTNKETLSLGIGCKLSDFQRTRVKPYELLEALKNHPIVRRLIAGSSSLEYSAHLIPEGGYHSMPPLYADGILIAGDAAQMINPTHREGSNLAMTAGKLAGETVIEAKRRGDFSARTLSLFRKKLEATYIIKDLEDHKDVEEKVQKIPELISVYPDLLCEAAYEYFTVDGLPKRDHQRRIIARIRRQRGMFQLLKDAFRLRKVI
ncbi:MAG: FAD-dependent monooxygenase [Elusimicrobia bacterium]|nr:FAD-dependent monooxygenase [Elusimicrobiota bacterium]